jgi:N-acylglucosamine 2-epimerase
MATGDKALRDESFRLLDCVLRWIKDPSLLGRPAVPGAIAYSPLNVPMILLNVISELKPDTDKYAPTVNWCVDEIRRHFVTVPGAGDGGADLKVVLENVLPDGSIDMSTPDGRLVNPGHAIEAGWFLLDHAVRVGDAALKAEALEIIDLSFSYGWDKEAKDGGIIYFRDVLGFSPTQLEWPMKLWWPHCEAMVAFAMAFAETKEAKYAERFALVAEWAYSHLVDKEHGEWYGYATREGVVTHTFKGSLYKGCFHVPRALWLSSVALGKALA